MGICWTKRTRGTNIFEASRVSAAVAPSSSPPYDFSNKFQLFGIELCPLTSRIRIALQHKGINVDLICLSSQDLKTKNKEWLASVCPKGKLPILQHGEKIIDASIDKILEYIEATTCEPPLLPKDASENKHVQDWVGYVRDTFSPAIEQVLYDKNPYAQQDLEIKLNAAFAKLDSGIWEHSKEGPYFLGQKFSLVDVYLIPFLELLHPLAYFRGIEISSVHFHLIDYTKRMISFPSYVSVRVNVDQLLLSVAKALAEGDLPAVTVTMLQHRSILWHMDKLIELADELVAAKQGVAPVKSLVGMKVKKLSKEYAQLVEVMQEHAQMEERVIFPALEKVSKGVTEHSNSDHARDLPLMNGIQEDIKSILALELGSAMYNEALLALAIRLRTFKAYTANHFQEEEKELLPLLEIGGLGSKQQSSLISRCMTVMDSSCTKLLPYLLSGLRAHEIHQYMSTLQKCLEKDKKSTFIARMIQSLKNTEEDLKFVWEAVEERIPALASWSTLHDSNCT